MNQKIENYVDMLFKDVPRTKKAIEIREELLSDLGERFDDLVREGKSENEAYGTAVAGMGNIDELLKEVTPDDEFKKNANYYHKRKALFIAIGVGLYILGAMVLIGLGAMGELVWGDSDIPAIIGLLILLLFAAVATGLIIYGCMSTPIEYRDFEEQREREKTAHMSIGEKTFRSISSIYWLVILFIYLVISFTTFSWGMSWIIWPLAGILWGIIKTIFEMRNADE